MRITRASGVIVAELTRQHTQATKVSEDMIYEWLGMHHPRFQHRYKLMAKALWYRYCHPTKFSYPRIAELLNCRPNYAQEVVHDGINKLMRYPNFYCVEEEQGKAIEVGTQLYAELFGCELRCCISGGLAQHS